MTEAKSPREIAEELWLVVMTSSDDKRAKAAIETALLSYAAERERLVADAEDSAVESHKLAHEWMVKHDKLLGFIQKRPAMLKELIEQDRLSSRPATEGKGDD